MRSDVNTFDLVERNLLVEPIVELGGGGRLMLGDRGRELEINAVSKLLRDPAAAESVRANLDAEPRLSRPTLDHLEGAQARHRPILECIARPGPAALEQRSAAVFTDTGNFEVCVDAGLRCVVGADHRSS